MRPWVHMALAFSAQTGPSVGPMCGTTGHTVPTPAPQLLELQAIPGAHALGGCTGQPLSARCLAPSRLHSHVKNVREQAGDESLQSTPTPPPSCGGRRLWGRLGGRQPDPAFPSAVRERQVGCWGQRGQPGAGGSQSRIVTFPLHPRPLEPRGQTEREGIANELEES